MKRRISSNATVVAGLAVLAVAVVPVPALAQGTLFVVNNQVGIGTETPEAGVNLHIVEAAADAKFKIEGDGGFTGFVVQNTSAAAGVSWQFTHGAGGAFAIDDSEDGTQEFRVFPNGDARISGALTTSGAACSITPCDAVFEPGFELESIEEHAKSMWDNSYLPAIGPTHPDMPMNLSEKTAGILNELEKAHIYIAQLNETLAELRAEVEDLKRQR